MSEQLPTEVTEEEEEVIGDPADDSLLAGLRAKRQAIGERKSLDLDIPGYNGELVGRYRYIEFEEVSEILRKAQKRSQDRRIEVKAAADLLIRMCEEILVRIDGDLVPLGRAVREFDGDQITFTDPRLAQAVGVEDKLNGNRSARQMVIAVFGNDYALISHQNEVARWVEDSERSSDF